MHIRKYKVRKMSEGLERIKRDLGPNAVILSTTRLVGQANGETLEIAVATDGLPGIPASVTRPAAPTKAAEPAPATPAPAPVPTVAAEPKADPMVRELVDQVRSLQSEVRHLRVQRELQNVPPRIPRQASERTSRPDPRIAAGIGMAVAESGGESSLARTMSFVYQTLRTSGVSESDIEAVVSEAWEMQQQTGRGPQHLLRLIEDRIAKRIETTAPLWHQAADQPQVAVLLGPTGVGKTTTLAKIAAHAKLIGHRNVGIICADTFRIGGVYQLDSYAQLIGVPLHVAASFAELQVALHAMEDCDLILIDTAGRNPWSPISDGSIPHEDYRRLAPRYDVQIHVCLSSTTRTDDLVAIVDRYRNLDPTALIFTKADEAQGVGCMLSAAVAAELPISHVCHGQSVPDDIACPTPGEIARWVRTGHPNGWSAAAAAAASSER